MKLKRSSRSPEQSLAFLDAQMESYMRWRAESTSAARSYRDWECAPPDDRAMAFGSYLAALDREEMAAGDYRRALEQIPALDYYPWS
jgi:hypothetical protein